MLERMTRLWLFAFLPFVLLKSALTQTACSPASEASVAAEVKRLQSPALEYKIMPMDSGVPAAAAGMLLRLKEGLAKVSDMVLACQDPSASPSAIQQKIAALLPVNRSAEREKQKPPTPDNDMDKPISGVLGNDIVVEVALVSTDSRILEVVLSSSEPCGTDSQLLLYQPEGNSWRRVMRWSAPLISVASGRAARNPGTNLAWLQPIHSS